MQFDRSKTYAENVEAFLTECEAIDAEMATILRENFQLLERVDVDNIGPATRAPFAMAVISALEPDPMESISGNEPQ